MSEKFLEAKSLVKEYSAPGGAVVGLRLDSFSADRGEALAIEGPSGSGKTTFLHLLAALCRPTCGDIVFGGTNIGELFRDRKTDRWRARTVGYVFQNMNLLPDFSALENIMIAAEISGVPRDEARERAESLMSRLELSDRVNHRPSQMSLGEQQRTAVARAVIHRPPLVLADEPTASLDARGADRVLDLLTELCEESESLLIVATHDEAVKRRFRRVVSLQKAERNLS